jgi:hypothetical protein
MTIEACAPMSTHTRFVCAEPLNQRVARHCFQPVFTLAKIPPKKKAADSTFLVKAIVVLLMNIFMHLPSSPESNTQYNMVSLAQCEWCRVGQDGVRSMLVGLTSTLCT